MSLPSNPWKVTDDEWAVVSNILAEPINARRGRPRIEDVRSIAEACLYRSFHSQSTGRNHCFDWNKLPAEFGISGSTANRRYREWSDSGAWLLFWTTLMRLRDPGKRARPRKGRRPTAYPVSDLLGELQRAYHFFDRVLFGRSLPEQVAITVLRGPGPRNSLGYFCGKSWRWGRDEPVDLIAIAGSAIQRGTDAALETLIHEMTHLRDDRIGLVDCTNRGMYHNRHFRDSAVLAGLLCGDCDKNHGYGFTHLGERARWAVKRLRPKTALFASAKPPGGSMEAFAIEFE